MLSLKQNQKNDLLKWSFTVTFFFFMIDTVNITTSFSLFTEFIIPIFTTHDKTATKSSPFYRGSVTCIFRTQIKKLFKVTANNYLINSEKFENFDLNYKASKYIRRQWILKNTAYRYHCQIRKKKFTYHAIDESKLSISRNRKSRIGTDTVKRYIKTVGVFYRRNRCFFFRHSFSALLDLFFTSTNFD